MFSFQSKEEKNFVVTKYCFQRKTFAIKYSRQFMLVSHVMFNSISFCSVEAKKPTASYIRRYINEMLIYTN